MSESNPITCNLDLDAPGKHAGTLDLVHSDNQHSMGVIPVPIAVINNGPGPTALVTAGNHGDEYEGQVIVRDLFHALTPGDITGRLILMPALNYPAMLDNHRVSPLDGGNMNRSFPGDPSGGPTAVIAHYLDSVLFPLCDGGIDLHSGGRQAHYVNCAFVCLADDAELSAANMAMAEAFGAPFTYVMHGRDAGSGLDPAANRQGTPFISAELSGGGGVDRHAVALGAAGTRRLLVHLGVLKAEPEEPAPNTQFVTGIEALAAPFSGIFAPAIDKGERVTAGQIAGTLYSVEELERAPEVLHVPADGVVIARPAPARVRRGTHLCLISRETDRATLLGEI